MNSSPNLTDCLLYLVPGKDGCPSIEALRIDRVASNVEAHHTWLRVAPEEVLRAVGPAGGQW